MTTTTTTTTTPSRTNQRPITPRRSGEDWDNWNFRSLEEGFKWEMNNVDEPIEFSPFDPLNFIAVFLKDGKAVVAQVYDLSQADTDALIYHEPFLGFVVKRTPSGDRAVLYRGDGSARLYEVAGPEVNGLTDLDVFRQAGVILKDKTVAA
jgi:hypothetical protein